MIKFNIYIKRMSSGCSGGEPVTRVLPQPNQFTEPVTACGLSIVIVGVTNNTYNFNMVELSTHVSSSVVFTTNNSGMGEPVTVQNINPNVMVMRLDPFTIILTLTGLNTNYTVGTRFSTDLKSVDIAIVSGPFGGIIGATEEMPTPTSSNNNYCTNPTIQITVQTSINSGDVLEAIFNVRDECVYECEDSCYKCCTSLIDHGTKFTVYSLFINCTVIGNGTLRQKFPDNNLRLEVIKYAMIKLILGRLLCGDLERVTNRNEQLFSTNEFTNEFNIKWLYRCNFETLLNKINCSRYNAFVPILLSMSNLEQYFRICCC